MVNIRIGDGHYDDPFWDVDENVSHQPINVVDVILEKFPGLKVIELEFVVQ